MSRLHYFSGLEKYPVYPVPSLFREMAPADSSYFMPVIDAAGANVIAPEGAGLNSYMIQEFPYGFAPDAIRQRFQLRIASGEGVFLEAKHLNGFGGMIIAMLEKVEGRLKLRLCEQQPRSAIVWMTMTGPELDPDWHHYEILYTPGKTEVKIDGVAAVHLAHALTMMNDVRGLMKTQITWRFTHARCFLSKPEFTAVSGEAL